MSTIVNPEEMPESPFGDPRKFYWILRRPAPFAGMSYPRDDPWRELGEAGFDSVVCLTDDEPAYAPDPLRVLKSVHFKDLADGSDPCDPKREAAALLDIVAVIVEELREGRGVAVHCEGGTGRTGTVVACVLRALGVPLVDVLDHMKRLNRVRGKTAGWPESEWQRRQVERWIADE